jgi:hypothetical protein
VDFERAAEGLDTLPHTRQAQWPRRAVPLVARGETLAIIRNSDPELIRTHGRETHRGLLCRGVLAHVGQGLLDDPEDLERYEWCKPVGRVVRVEAGRKLVPFFKLVRVIPKSAD